MIRRNLTALALIGALAVGGCANSGYGQKQSAGAVLGGVGGAVAGAQFGKGTGQLAATALGALLGAYAGSEVGRSLDHADQMAMQQAQKDVYRAPMGTTIRWENPQSGNSGTYVPVRETRDTSSGAYCREYQTTIYVGGRAEQGTGTACRQPDGSWRVVN